MDSGDLRRINQHVRETGDDNKAKKLSNAMGGIRQTLTDHQQRYLRDLMDELEDSFNFEQDPVEFINKIEDSGKVLEGKTDSSTYKFEFYPKDTEFVLRDTGTGERLYSLDEQDIKSNNPDPESAYEEILEEIELTY